MLYNKNKEYNEVIDYKFPDDKSCLDRIKGIMDKIGHFETAGFNRVKPQAPKKDPKEIIGIMPASRSKTYDSRIAS